MFSPRPRTLWLWFAEKFVSLLIEQHPDPPYGMKKESCDLLKNSYLCLLNNTLREAWQSRHSVVICWKIRIFAYWTTPSALRFHIGSVLWFAEKFVSLLIEQHLLVDGEVKDGGCDLLKNSYLCLLNNTRSSSGRAAATVVICWKIRIFAYWTTPSSRSSSSTHRLWFAEKFVSLLIEQHPAQRSLLSHQGCDLLKNSYLCLLNNTKSCM